ncbi:MAG: FecR domain-containing protein, partial [Bacteroidota bacterium]
PNEKRLVEEWLESVKDDAVLSEEEFSDSIDSIKSKLWSSAGLEENQVQLKPLYSKLLQYAAVFLMLISIGFGYYYWSNSVSTDPSVIFARGTYESFATARAEKRTVQLDDGSTIWLNYESQLKVAQTFNVDDRVVFLSGHAHFDVAPDADRPFIVYTDQTATKVVGTSFDIKAFTNLDDAEVIVTSGRVEFSELADTENKVALSVNDRATLTSGQKIEVSEVDAARLTAWRNDRLIFDYQSLAEIIEVLEPWYDIDITVNDPVLLEKVYRFAYDNPSLPVLLEQMSFVGDFDYRIDGKKVIIF